MRTCPKCKKEIKSDKALFCYYCGAILTLSSDKSDVCEKTSSLEEKDGGKGGKLNKKTKVMPIRQLALFSIPAIFIGILAFVLKGEEGVLDGGGAPAEIQQIEEQKEPNKDADLLKSDNLKSEFLIGSGRYEMATPLDASLYMEASNVEDVLRDNEKEAFSKVFTSIFDLPLEEALALFKEDFGVFKTNDGWGFLFSPLDSASVADKARDALFRDEAKYKGAYEGRYFLVYNDDSVYESFLDVSQKLSKSLGMDAKFLQVLKFIPEKGYLFGFSNFDDSGLLEDALAQSPLDFGMDGINLEGVGNYFYVIKEGGSLKIKY